MSSRLMNVRYSRAAHDNILVHPREDEGVEITAYEDG